MSIDHLPPSQRKLMASMAANIRWSRTTADERRDATEAARAARVKSWEQKADPDGRMTPGELADAVARLKTAHYSLMALRSAQARSARRTA